MQWASVIITTAVVSIASTIAAAASAKLLQSCLTLCDPTDGSPPGSPVPGILQARTLEWVAIAFSSAYLQVTSLSLSSVLYVCSDVVFFLFILFGTWWASWIWEFICFVSSGKFPAFLLSLIVPYICSLSYLLQTWLCMCWTFSLYPSLHIPFIVSNTFFTMLFQISSSSFILSLAISCLLLLILSF